jgi:hypothetical protein
MSDMHLYGHIYTVLVLPRAAHGHGYSCVAYENRERHDVGDINMRGEPL